MNRIMIIDDDADIRGVLKGILTAEGYAVAEAESGMAALAAVKAFDPDAVLLDFRMPEMDGMQTMEALLKQVPGVSVIIMTAYGDVPTAVEAIKKGAYDFTMKPPDFERLLITLKRAVERRVLEADLGRYSTALEVSLESMLGKSPSMKSVITSINQVAGTNMSVIIQGETGTGKSYIASALHNVSRRAKGPFVRVDMGLIPDTLFESELFGYRKGAFTGADRNKAGYFETSNNGSMFLDEIENMPLSMQGKLLSAMDEKKVYPLGSTTPVNVDVRIIAATNRDIRSAVKRKEFREDLYYRMGEFVITVPPLRERIEDIPFFAEQFARDAGEEMGKRVWNISVDAMDVLTSYNWPGNIRELKNVMRKAALTAPDGFVDRRVVANMLTEQSETEGLVTYSLKDAIKEVEKQKISMALKRAAGNKTRACELLQISYKSLLDKIKLYELE